MAIIVGYLLSSPTPTSGLPSRRAEGYLVPITPFSSGLPDKRRDASLLVIGGGTVTIYYQKRARDLGSPGSVYTEWVSTDINSLPPTAPPIGPWGEIVILAQWQ